MKRALSILLTFALAAFGGAGASSARPVPATVRPQQDPTDPGAKRDKVRKEKAAAAAKLDALKADAAEVDQALTDLSTYVDSQQAELASSKAAEVEANQAVVDAQAEVESMNARIAMLEVAVRKAALQAFTKGADSSIFSTLMAGRPDDVMETRVMYDLATGNVTEALDELNSARSDLKKAKAKADKAAARAAEHRLSVQSKLGDLNDAIAQQQQLGVSINDRMDETLSEAAGLAAIDKKLSAEITARELALAARVPTAKVTQDDNGNVKVTVPVIPLPVNGLVTVNGITVDASIGSAVAQLVSEAAADGINLSGGGYRSANDQIAVRRNNCGPTDYDIWQRPSTQCHPPAARPGKSMHEQGLAIDFACDGALASSYSGSCYAWLAAHAPQVGLQNRRAGREAWHWSVNGN
jgi:LAS superfamily LD-carboxypeptidase LdcB